MQFGFSIVGLVMLAMLFIPNIAWGRNQPLGYSELARRESAAMRMLERIGQVAVTASALIFACPQGYALPWLWWLIAAFALMLFYEIAWARYFRDERELGDMYAPLGFIPLPLATLPVAAFIFYGIWQQSPITVIAAIILGIGHIGIHSQHSRDLKL
ncbi:hypothetical protein [Adlercreutzia equolifaciens]|uniref:hypothetical protein n=1 Tax=Adlercreutzia equolifaciens TaxID=446660 RepID=UPI0039F5EF7F